MTFGNGCNVTLGGAGAGVGGGVEWCGGGVVVLARSSQPSSHWGARTLAQIHCQMLISDPTLVGLYIAIIKDLPFEWQGMAEVALSHADLRQGANMLTC